MAADFVVTAAHLAIDAGADIFVGHGPHILRGIEIYKGKPIFYSMANFAFENETMRFQPAESYAALGLPSSPNVWRVPVPWWYQPNQRPPRYFTKAA